MKCPEYFDAETICGSCEKNIKKKNQIVCSKCHNDMKSEPI